MSDLGDFYDEWSEHQIAEGINDRHLAIEAALRRAGWRAHHRVLEVGAGVGTLTELLARGLAGGGSLVAIDLSPKSIEAARSRLASFAGVTLLAGDVIESSIIGPFDVIVLPDVIEHIPIEVHGRLFARLASLLDPDGFILLNYPNPFYLAWCHVHKPEILQPLDQPIYTDALLTTAAASGLYLYDFTTYSIWVREGDYVTAVLRPVQTNAHYNVGLPTRRTQLLGALRRLRIALRRP